MSVLALLVTAAFAHGGPPAHAAAVCADFPNQAAAQRAHNTRDGDGDGIYCEDLPCPCLKPGGGSPAPAPTPPPAPPPIGDLGRSITLAPVTQLAGCHVRGKLPDPDCTPGARFAKVTRADVCTPGYSSAVRNVSSATKDVVYAAYGIATHFDGTNGEVDHLVSLELGGSNARSNLFPEAAPGSHQKDRLENALHDEVCSGKLRLRAAQRLIATNWVAAFRARFGRTSPAPWPPRGRWAR
jgi:hypothetical protein